MSSVWGLVAAAVMEDWPSMGSLDVVIAWRFPKSWGYPNGGFIMEHLIKIDDSGLYPILRCFKKSRFLEIEREVSEFH